MRDCNNCINHVQAAVPPPLCAWCLTSTIENPHKLALPCFVDKDAAPMSVEPKAAPMLYAHLGYSRSDTSANAVQVGGDHYKGDSIQPWDYILSNGLGYCEGAVVKYVTRYKHKNGIEDLQKARHFLDKLIEYHNAKEAA
jgi:hypothetical protein